MEDHSQSVMIALLPTTSDWCHIELPHLTLVYAGEIDSLTPGDYNELGKDVLSLSREFGPIELGVIGPDVLGEKEPVDVLTLFETPELSAMRAKVEHWNASQYDFNPHVTVGPLDSLEGTIPNSILFDRIMLGWGQKGFNCNLTPQPT